MLGLTSRSPTVIPDVYVLFETGWALRHMQSHGVRDAYALIKLMVAAVLCRHGKHHREYEAYDALMFYCHQGADKYIYSAEALALLESIKLHAQQVFPGWCEHHFALNLPIDYLKCDRIGNTLVRVPPQMHPRLAAVYHPLEFTW